MTVDQFMGSLEDYYGPYPPERRTARAYVSAYLRDMSEGERFKLWKRVCMEVSGRYRMAPDIADLEAVRRKMLSEPEYPAFSLPAPDVTELERAQVAERLIDLRLELEARNG